MGLTNHRDHCGCMYSAYTVNLELLVNMSLFDIMSSLSMSVVQYVT